MIVDDQKIHFANIEHAENLKGYQVSKTCIELSGIRYQLAKQCRVLLNNIKMPLFKPNCKMYISRKRVLIMILKNSTFTLSSSGARQVRTISFLFSR